MKNIALIGIFTILCTGCASQPNFPKSIDPAPISFCNNSQDASRWRLPENNWKNAFLHSMAGDQETARVFAYGGNVKFEYDYSIKGHIIRIERNEVGIVRVRDELKQCDLTPVGYNNMQLYGQ